jgi:hypothetical protein
MHIAWTCLHSLDIHDVLNVNNLKLFEPPLLEEASQFIIRWIIFQIFNLLCSLIPFLTPRPRTTRQQKYVSYLVGRKGQTPTQAKWMSTETLQRNFPHLLVEAGMLPDLNREELGHQEVCTTSLATHDEGVVERHVIAVVEGYISPALGQSVDTAKRGVYSCVGSVSIP